MIRFVKSWILARLGKYKPVILAHMVTYRCNMRCIYCEYWKRKSREMKEREVEEMLKEAAELGIAVYTATGGEPLLWNVSHALKVAKDYGFYTMLATNGLLLKNKKLEADIISVSLDTLKRERFLKITGVDAIDRVKEAIRWASERYRVCINCVLYGENVEEVENIVRFAESCNAYVTFEPVSPYFEGCPSLSGESMREVAERILELKREFKNVLNTKAYLKMLGRERFKCISNLLLRVNPDGEIISPCYELNYVRAGNVKDGIKNVIESEKYRKGVEMAGDCRRECYLLCYAEPSMIFSSVKCTLGFLLEELRRGI